MTKDEFEKRYAERSDMVVEELRELGVTIEPCDCGDILCLGWQAVSQRQRKLKESKKQI